MVFALSYLSWVILSFGLAVAGGRAVTLAVFGLLREGICCALCGELRSGVAEGGLLPRIPGPAAIPGRGLRVTPGGFRESVEELASLWSVETSPCAE